MTPNLALLSSKVWDIDFLKALKEATFRSKAHFFDLGTEPAAIGTFLQKHANVIFFVDFELLTALETQLSSLPDRVWAIGDAHPSTYPLQHVLTQANHYILRGLDPRRSAEAVAQITGLVTVTPRPGGKAIALPDIYGIGLKKSSDRQIALDELQRNIENWDVPTRLREWILQGADELLMNAIFDAPIDDKGVRFRYFMSRGEQFELTREENVRVQLAAGPRFGVLSVLDAYGSLKKEELLSEKPPTPAECPSAGLGIKWILKSGLSLSFVVQPGSLTQASLVFPRAGTLSEARGAFQAMSFRELKSAGQRKS